MTVVVEGVVSSAVEVVEGITGIATVLVVVRMVGVFNSVGLVCCSVVGDVTTA
jgi:hypothetical protein